MNQYRQTLENFFLIFLMEWSWKLYKLISLKYFEQLFVCTGDRWNEWLLQINLIFVLTSTAPQFIRNAWRRKKLRINSNNIRRDLFKQEIKIHFGMQVESVCRQNTNHFTIKNQIFSVIERTIRCEDIFFHPHLSLFSHYQFKIADEKI